MVDFHTIHALRNSRAGRQITKKPNKKKRPPKTFFPVPVEVAYEKVLVDYVNEIGDIANNLIIPFIPGLINERNAELPPDARVKNDGWEESIDRLSLTYNFKVNAIPFNEKANATIMANATDVWNTRQWNRVMQSTFGTNIFKREPWLNSTLKSTVSENVQLIGKMTDDNIRSIQGIVQRGIRGGETSKTIGKNIQEQTNTTRNRARLIARDQVSKLNGTLTELRQVDVGVSKYTWRDSDDRRVRPTHQQNDGKVFTWNKAPSTGHPGQDIQCRCTAEAIFDETIDEL